MSQPDAADALVQEIARISAQFELPAAARQSLFNAALSLAGDAPPLTSLAGATLVNPEAGAELEAASAVVLIRGAGASIDPLRRPVPAGDPDLGAASAVDPLQVAVPAGDPDLGAAPAVDPLRVAAPAAHVDRARGPSAHLSASAPPFPMSVLRAERDHQTRYHDLGLIGAGGMGEVRRVRDRTLNRIMAMKIIRAELLENPTALVRFTEEAQATAQLQHPGIVPVHELGRLQDGRVYFTMKEVQGATLREVIDAVHAASPADRWLPAPSPLGGPDWTFRRLIDAFHKVCEAMAYAHSRGVVHRDLKPSNIMVGSFGEVLVLDWGLAKVLARGAAAPDTDAIVTDRSSQDAMATRAGTVTGTPAYMPPEQALGQIDRLGPPADVYALGAILYEILSGRPPYFGTDQMAVLAQVVTGPPIPPGRLSSPSAPPGDTLSQTLSSVDLFASSLPAPTPQAGPPLPEELLAICQKAMAREPGDRCPDALALAIEVGAWLDGAQRRERALQVLEEAEALVPEVDGLRARAGELRQEARQVLAAVKPWEPVAHKEGGWALEDEARQLERASDLKETGFVQKLQGALTHDPDLPEAHEDLADYYRTQHAAAEAAGDVRSAARIEVLLQSHDRGRYADYLKGDGAVTLVTDPPGAEVLLYRYVERGRRLVPELVGPLGRTPLRAVSLPMGSYRLEVRALGRAPVSYPVFIGRQEHWDGCRPGDSEPYPIYLPRLEALGPDDCYVPAGWFWSGGDPQASESLPRRRLWIDGFVIRRFPVTNREYIDFLNDLIAHRQTRAALRHAPRERAARKGQNGALIYGRDDDGRIFLKMDAEGDFWLPDWPAVMIEWFGAEHYARWEAGRSGLGWRLPGELEWEKAARGVDGRFFPWGNFPDPTWACMHDSFREDERPLPQVVDSFPVDESPYGVRGMAGNVRDWCRDPYRREGPPVEEGLVLAVPEPEDPKARRIVRGGCWFWHHSRVRIALHQGVEPWHRDSVFGFRIARGL